jgi:large subunit ribosomal protein L11
MADNNKKVKAVVKMLIKAGAANPAPPVGSTLGPYGIALPKFCQDFNEQTSSMTGMVPVVVTIYEDRSFEFVLKTAPVAELVKQALGIKSGAAHQIKDKVGQLSYEQAVEIAEKKMVDLNCYDVDAALQMVGGTCKSMGVTIAGK